MSIHFGLYQVSTQTLERKYISTLLVVDLLQVHQIRGGRSHIFRLRHPSCSKIFRFRIRVRKFFKFENPIPVQTPATIDAIKIQQCFCH